MNLRTRKVEKNRDEVRKLSQKDGNKFCINCGMRGPLYVVLNFRTFVCSTCAALHRSLQHKVKGISMSEFNEAEVAALVVGGNDRAGRVWLRGYHKEKPQHGNDNAIRNFIISAFDDMTYVDRDEFDRYQNDVLKAINHETVETPITSLPPPPPPQQQQQQEQEQKLVSSSVSSKPQNIPSLETPEVDLFVQSKPQVSQSASVNPSIIQTETEEDLFDDFFTAAAPPPPVPAPPTTSPSSITNVSNTQSSIADWFTSTSSAAPQGNSTHYSNSGFTGVPLPSQAPQSFPVGQLQQPQVIPQYPSPQNFVGMNQMGYNTMPYTFSPSTQQQFQPPQNTFSMGVPTPPIVVLNKTPPFYSPQPLVSGGVSQNMNSVNFFQAPPSDPWTMSQIPESIKTEAKGQASNPTDDAFAFLNPFDNSSR